jgi:hypothetical protein
LPALFAFIRPRLAPALLGLACVVAGVLLRTLMPRTGGAWWWWKWPGVVLWCWVVLACVLCIRPRLCALHAGLWALAFSWTIELAQLTGVPRWLSAQHIVLRLIFGEVFSVFDLLASALAIVAGAWLWSLVAPAPPASPPGAR